MRFHFTSGPFFTIRIRKYLLIVFAYILITTYPLLSFFPHDLIPEINFRDLLTRLTNLFYTPIVACMGVQVLTISLVKDLVEEMFFCVKNRAQFIEENGYIKDSRLLNIQLKNNFNLLDSFNPFLYKDKTRELLE